MPFTPQVNEKMLPYHLERFDQIIGGYTVCGIFPPPPDVGGYDVGTY